MHSVANTIKVYSGLGYVYFEATQTPMSLTKATYGAHNSTMMDRLVRGRFHMTFNIIDFLACCDSNTVGLYEVE